MQTPLQPPKNKWTIIELITWTTGYFKTHNIDSPRTTAEIFLAHVLSLRRIDLYLRYDQPLTEEELSQFKALIRRRIRREPVAYILGLREFWSLELQVTPHTLIPRPETECLIEASLSCLPEFSPSAENGKACKIVDLGTGTGAIILSLASERPGHEYFAVDRSVEALKTAKQNAAKHGFENRVHFLAGDWLSAFKTGPMFDMILANPPYIPTKTIALLQPEIFQYEPLSALDGGPDGLDCLRQITLSAHRFLKPGGYLILEMGHDQKAGMERIAAEASVYDSVAFSKDYGGNHRVVKMQKTRKASSVA
ncbi:MAG: peptide chain release factor N(5)-glutamine methyltransferase [Proteobacteria bacterium]|nr:peptide chain release factor N(5)-glutamine methyltransferase [Pseudomonadota bacterium]MBU4472485.1 peptide chain release factor N(5)-glutamine methyltransferase [Pseudomonadota bacterium]MCG2751311.1 peptide chain release factor N(5)-glutamine methyltransferase [Desulfobacteraceae bacterium]